MRADAKALIGKANLPTNPAVNVGGVGTFLAAVFVLVNTFWPRLMTDTTETAILSVAAILAPVILGFIIRSKVWSPSSVRQVIESVYRETAVQSVKPNDEKPPTPRLL